MTPIFVSTASLLFGFRAGFSKIEEGLLGHDLQKSFKKKWFKCKNGEIDVFFSRPPTNADDATAYDKHSNAIRRPFFSAAMARLINNNLGAWG
jgi:hypothetical protein